jgi:hypothetical protein
MNPALRRTDTLLPVNRAKIFHETMTYGFPLSFPRGAPLLDQCNKSGRREVHSRFGVGLPAIRCCCAGLPGFSWCLRHGASHGVMPLQLAIVLIGFASGYGEGGDEKFLSGDRH